jgi:hypothetical protein
MPHSSAEYMVIGDTRYVELMAVTIASEDTSVSRQRALLSSENVFMTAMKIGEVRKGHSWAKSFGNNRPLCKLSPGTSFVLAFREARGRIDIFLKDHYSWSHIHPRRAFKTLPTEVVIQMA